MYICINNKNTMKDLKKEIHEMKLLHLYWEETRKEAIVREEDLKRRNREFSSKLIKPRS